MYLRTSGRRERGKVGASLRPCVPQVEHDQGALGQSPHLEDQLPQGSSSEKTVRSPWPFSTVSTSGLAVSEKAALEIPAGKRRSARGAGLRNMGGSKRAAGSSGVLQVDLRIFASR